MITPTLNMNGSSADDLIKPRLKAIKLMKDAIEALLQVTPNGRDYANHEECVADRKKHYDRIEVIYDIWNEIYSEAIDIKEQEQGA
jgi:hypothetical protein